MQIQVRNPQHNAVGTIDMEIEHPAYGWIPFTASSDDTEQMGRELYAQAAAGNFGPVAEYVAPPPPPPPPPVIPTSVTMRQARLALLGAGLLDQVNAAITDPAAQIEWEYATTVDRTSDLTQALAAGLGLTEQQLDELFTQASAL
jgi:hypothetical protein